MLSPEEYGIDIVSPADYAQVDKSFDVSGTYRALPPGQRIWVSTFSVDKDGNVSEYWPQGAAKAADRKWYGRVHNIGGKAGETKEFLVLAVGQDGDTLFRHY